MDSSTERGDKCNAVVQPMSIEDAESQALTAPQNKKGTDNDCTDINDADNYVPNQKGVLSVLLKNSFTTPSALSPTSISHTCHQSATDYLQSKEFVLLYFSASWCPPCRKFSPILSKFALTHKDSVGVIFMSNDTSEAEAEKYLAGKYFSFAGYQTQAHSILNQLLSITMLPSLVIMNRKTGKVITHWGRSAVEGNSERCVQDWRDGKSGVSLLSYCSIS